MTDKPKISNEARGRILAFVNAIEHLQVAYGVELATLEGAAIVFRDMKRKDEWITDGGDSYGCWDAFIFSDGDKLSPGDQGAFRVANVEFEDFDGWET